MTDWAEDPWGQTDKTEEQPEEDWANEFVGAEEKKESDEGDWAAEF